MALGSNRKRNAGKGVPVQAGTGADQLLRPIPTEPGQAALYGFGTGAIPCMVETVPKTGPGLPSGDNAEEYMVDFGPAIWHAWVAATTAGGGDAVTPGENIRGVVVGIGSGVTDAVAQVGDWANRQTTWESGNANEVTIATFPTGRAPVVLKILDGSASIPAGERKLCEVMIGL